MTKKPLATTSSNSLQHFSSATWSRALKVVSFFGSLLLIGVGIAAVNAIPQGTHVPYAETVGTLVAFVPPAIALFTLLYVVIGYELKAQQLRIRRLLWFTDVPLYGLQRIYADPVIMKCSIKVCGNGGLFSITGVYQNSVLGRYRAFVTNPEKAVALVLSDRTIVISPESPEDFVQAIRLQFPNVHLERCLA